MIILKYILLGIIQGFTEPLPISSSGHLRIIKSIFNDSVLSDLNFEIIVNFGSLIAIVFLYRKEIIKIIKEFFGYIKTKDNKYKTNYDYAFKIVIGTIPVAVFGILLKDLIEKYYTTKMIGISFLITSIFLFLIKDIKGKKEKKDITFIDSIKVGLFQVVALLPGISRSGATITGCMLGDFKRDTALDYSFMLYIPVSIASMILGVKDLLESSNLSSLLVPYSLSLIASTIVTYYSAKLFINLMKKGKLIYFSIYTFILGLLIFILF